MCNRARCPQLGCSDMFVGTVDARIGFCSGIFAILWDVVFAAITAVSASYWREWCSVASASKLKRGEGEC